MIDFSNQFNEFDDYLMKLFSKFNEPYISPLLEDTLTNQTKIDYYLFIKSEENIQKLNKLFENLSMQDKDKSISECMKANLDEAYEKIIVNILNVKIDFTEIIDSFVKIETKMKRDLLDSQFKEEAFNLIINNSLLNMTNKISGFN